MLVPFLDLKPAYLELKEDLDAAYRRVMDSGSYVLGKEVATFEDEFGAYCGARHCVGVASGPGNTLSGMQLRLTTRSNSCATHGFVAICLPKRR